MRVLIVNAGSSSLKLSVLDHDDTVLGQRSVEMADGQWSRERLRQELEHLPPSEAVGHRVVHGGELSEPTVLDEDVRARLATLTDLAPLHQPRSLAGIDLIGTALPDMPAVACFDTAFHNSLLRAAATYPVPAAWRAKYGLHRYGFHGLSHAYATRQVATLLGSDPGRMVTCHLGAGASLAAVRSGRSVDTTMGFTPSEGLVMATRSGSVDPGMLLWLQERAGVPVGDISHGLAHESGLRGLAGTADMREVIAGRDHGDAACMLAFDVYLHRLRAGIAAMAATLGGLDTLVFTAGVGENAPVVRQCVADGLEFIGVTVDPERNRATGTDAEIGVPGRPVRVFVIVSREDREIARGVRHVLGNALSW